MEKVFNNYEICFRTLNEQALRKEKSIAGNGSPLINKEISKAIIKWARLHSKYLKLRTN